MQTLDQGRIEAFAGQVATEIGAALNVALVTIGGRWAAGDGRRARSPDRDP
jgi:hypothetical protein